jgi:RNA polymerase sigma-70 factor (ECF subfamily)
MCFQQKNFPTTDWGLVQNIRSDDRELKAWASNLLASRYWLPVFSYLKRSGCEDAEAKDLTQSFFAGWMDNDGFIMADPAKGRLRSFMLTSLKHFVANERRAGKAQKRCPAKGVVSLDELMGSESHPFDPQDAELTPDKVFDRKWAVGLVMRVIRRLEAECANTGKAVHYDIFLQRIIDPILQGAQEVPLADLGAKHRLTEKQACNCLLTAKRAYRRLMEEEVRLYVETEAEVAEEIRDLFRILG